jgi:hypothetical protein
VLPTAFADAREFAENKDWLGRPIRPENPWDDSGPQAYKYYAGVSDMARTTADALNRLTGGNAAVSGMIDISPEYIDHAIGTMTGSAGRFWSETLDGAIKALSGRSDQIDSRNIPMASVLTMETGSWIDRRNFYDRRSEILAASNAVETAKEVGERARPLTTLSHASRSRPTVWPGSYRS